MRTPRSVPARHRLAIEAPASGGGDPSDAPSASEAASIARGVASQLEHYASQYDERKYWPELYAALLERFAEPKLVGGDEIRNALLWKYGHLGKKRIPDAQERLIAEVQAEWPTICSALPEEPEELFARLSSTLSSATRKRFITVAFLCHLLSPRNVPIIDQHNFRACNALMAQVRPNWKSKRKPSQLHDIWFVRRVMNRIRAQWPSEVGEPPDPGQLDRFLMMYGKAIKSRQP